MTEAFLRYLNNIPDCRTESHSVHPAHLGPGLLPGSGVLSQWGPRAQGPSHWSLFQLPRDVFQTKAFTFLRHHIQFPPLPATANGVKVNFHQMLLLFKPAAHQLLDYTSLRRKETAGETGSEFMFYNQVEH